MVTIIFTHPWHGSFNKAILDAITQKYTDDNIPYQVIDLCKDKFNAVMTEEDLIGYSKGIFHDPLVGQYQTMLKETSKLIILHPIWWNSAPAILQGFFDKVFLKDFSHNYENGWTPLLTNIKEALLITTSEQPTENIIKSGDNINALTKTTLAPVGVGAVKWLNCERVTGGGDKNRLEFLNKVKDFV